MQYHLGVLRMLLFSTLLVELKGMLSTSGSGTLEHSTGKNLKGKADMIKALESRLLTIFGLKQRPRPTGKAVVPEFMVELYRAQNLVQYEEKYAKLSSRKRALATHQLDRGRSLHSATANTVRSFVSLTEPIHEEAEEDSKELRLWFNVTSLPPDELLRATELRVFRTRRRAGCGIVRGGARNSVNGTRQAAHQKNKLKANPKVGGSGALYLQVYDVIRPSQRLPRNSDGNASTPDVFLETEPLLRLIDTRAIDTAHVGWESFDVMPAIRRWRNRPWENHGLVLRLAHSNGKTIPFHKRRNVFIKTRSAERCFGGIADASSPVDRHPLLVTYTDDSRDASLLRSSRIKRSSKKGHRKKRPACRRHPLYVDFNDVGWNDWIVAPPGYHAYFCKGDCNFPLADNLNSTNHAIVQTLVNSANPTLVPRACCVPTELSPISMLYTDEYDKVVLKNYQDMVVEGCGCR